MSLDHMPDSVIEMARRFPHYVRVISDFRLVRPLGRGGFGSVWFAIDAKTEANCAIKELFERSLTSRLEKSYIREVTSLALCNNRFVLQLVGFTIHPPYSIITVYQPGGELRTLVFSNSNKILLSGTHQTIIAMCLANALESIHEMKIIHRDMKSNNIFLDEKQMPRLGDFGIARFLTIKAPMTKQIGTLAFMAPEVHNTSHYSTKADIYGLGIILFEMAEKYSPFEGKHRDEIKKHLTDGKFKLDFTRNTPKSLQQLILKCISWNPAERPTATEIFDQFAMGQVSYSGADYKKVEIMAKKIRENEQKMKLSPPPLPTVYCDVEAIISSLKASERGGSNIIVEEEEEENDKLVPVSLSKFFDRTCPIHSNAVSINEQIILNCNHPSFFGHFISISQSMNDSTSAKFYDLTKKYFSKELSNEKMRLFTYKMYYNALSSSKSLIDICYDNGFFFNLPTNTPQFCEITLSILSLLFLNRPTAITFDLFGIIKTLMPTFIKEFLVLLYKYSRNSLPLPLILPVFSILLKLRPFIQNDQNTLSFIRVLLSFLFSNNLLIPLYNNDIVSILSQYIFSDNVHIVKEVYRFLGNIFTLNIDIDRETLCKHISNNSINTHMYSYLLKTPHIYPDSTITQVLISLSKDSEKWVLILLKYISHNSDCALYVARNQQWLQYPLANIQNNFKVLVLLIQCGTAKVELFKSQAYIPLLTNLIKTNENRYLAAISQLSTELVYSESMILPLTTHGFLPEFFLQTSKSNDPAVIRAGIKMIDTVSRIGYSPTFSLFVPKMIETLRLQNELSSMSILTFVTMSFNKEGAKILKNTGLVEYFQNLLKIPSYQVYAQQFLNNVAHV